MIEQWSKFPILLIYTMLFINVMGSILLISHLTHVIDGFQIFLIIGNVLFVIGWYKALRLKIKRKRKGK